MSDQTMRVLVTGSRKWTDRDTLEGALSIVVGEAFKAGCTRIVVVHGCAKGADQMAEYWAVRKRRDDWPIYAERHPADWKRHGRKAGFLRNSTMVKLGADVCLAFLLDDSPGTTQCGELAEREGIPTRWFRRYSDNPPDKESTDG